MEVFQLCKFPSKLLNTYNCIYHQAYFPSHMQGRISFQVDIQCRVANLCCCVVRNKINWNCLIIIWCTHTFVYCTQTEEKLCICNNLLMFNVLYLCIHTWINIFWITLEQKKRWRMTNNIDNHIIPNKIFEYQIFAENWSNGQHYSKAMSEDIVKSSFLASNSKTKSVKSSQSWQNNKQNP